MDTFYFRYNKISQKPFLLETTRITYNELTIVVKGELFYLINGETVSVKAGDCLFLKPGMRRQRLKSEQAEYVSFNFYDSRRFNLPTLFSNVLSAEIKMLITICSEIYFKQFAWEKKINKALDLLFALLEDKYAALDENPIIV